VILDRRDIGLAAADAELTTDVETVGLQHLCVDLGDDLRLREVRRTHLDGVEITRYRAAAQRIGAATRRDEHQEKRGQSREAAVVHGATRRDHANVLSTSLANERP
jgi:hypothetical protein